MINNAYEKVIKLVRLLQEFRTTKKRREEKQSESLMFIDSCPQLREAVEAMNF